MAEKPTDAQSLKGKTGFRRLINATRYSMQGFKAAFHNEAAFREETLLACVAIPIALLLPVTWIETALLICGILGLLLTEILNSALEAVVDRIGSEIHPLSGRAKDMGSAAVFLAMVMCALIWLSIIGPLCLEWFLA